MNKEQEKPQEDCYCPCHIKWDCHTGDQTSCQHCQELSSATLPRRICYLCEEEIPCEHYPQQEPQEDINRALHALAHRAGYEPNAWYEEELEGFINSYFIAKRDLRKLLEEKEIEYGKRKIIDDILASIEKT